MEPALVALVVVVVVVVAAQGLKFVHDAVQAMAAEHEKQARKARAAHQQRVQALVRRMEGGAEAAPAHVVVEQRPPPRRPAPAPRAVARPLRDHHLAEGLRERHLRDDRLTSRPLETGGRDEEDLGGAWRRIEALPPLQRALVLSEVFGTCRAKKRK